MSRIAGVRVPCVKEVEYARNTTPPSLLAVVPTAVEWYASHGDGDVTNPLALLKNKRHACLVAEKSIKTSPIAPCMLN